MGLRLDLHSKFKTMTPNVYFQPPTSLQMKYPAIVYERDNVLTDFADNLPYRHVKRYQVTVIDQDPESVISDKVADMPMSSFSRHFAAEQLNHDVYSLYF